ncbi:glutamyl-tRNA reductase [Rothia aeria]|uniref:Glutamyl-tRNA reductase n=1 Tax=Rothia aeria TaxID=172042 RepID=A0A2Z5R276_9MICC|nr:glutamyl-tRNA reductase [Rothia aeria]
MSELIFAHIATQAGLAQEIVSSSFEVYSDLESAEHLFTVASGLESAVVGEREIAGQVRRALATAQQASPVPGELVQLFEHAAHTARQVGQHTTIGSQGRSIVAVALDLADTVAEKDWANRRALIFGTGAYAGATIAALRERGCEDIWVNSRSGRAQQFAAKRDVHAVPQGHSWQAMAEADVIIGCSGGAAPLPPSDIPPVGTPSLIWRSLAISTPQWRTCPRWSLSP